MIALIRILIVIDRFVSRILLAIIEPHRNRTFTTTQRDVNVRLRCGSTIASESRKKDVFIHFCLYSWKVSITTLLST